MLKKWAWACGYANAKFTKELIELLDKEKSQTNPEYLKRLTSTATTDYLL